LNTTFGLSLARKIPEVGDVAEKSSSIAKLNVMLPMQVVGGDARSSSEINAGGTQCFIFYILRCG
jgi:hypothetical protein